MPFVKVPESKFDEAEPLDSGLTGVGGSCSRAGHDACRSLPSLPSSSAGSCFQPWSLPLPRPGERRGLPLSFVLVLAAMLAAGCAAWFLNAVSAVASYGSFSVLEWAALEADLVSYELVFFSGAREAELERHVPELSSLLNKDSLDGCKRPLEVAPQESVRKIIWKSPKG